MYGVKFVQDHELPEKEWALVRWSGRTRLFVRESAVCERVLEEAWAAYRQSVGVVDGRVPEQRPRGMSLAKELRPAAAAGSSG